MTKRASTSIRHATAPSRPALDDHTLACLGDQLRGAYMDPVTDKLPHELRGLLKRAFQVIRAYREPIDQAFVAEMMSALPELRVYALSLEKDPGSRRRSDSGDDPESAVTTRAIREGHLSAGMAVHDP
jgi:hypothetical protein